MNIDKEHYKQELEKTFTETTNVLKDFSIPEAVSGLLNNEIFLGFLALSIVGTIFYLSRNVILNFFRLLWKISLKQFTVELVLRNDSGVYDWILHWLHVKEYYNKTRRLRLSSRYLSNEDNDNWHLTLGDGWHFFFHNKSPILIHKQTQESKMKNPPEVFTLRTLGRSKKTILSIIEDAKKISEKDDCIKLFVWDSYGWNNIGQRTKRELETVVLEKNEKEKLIKDLEWFLNNKDWYTERGVPYRRGYLFHGPPGTGKSSLAFALACYFNKNLYIMNINNVSDDNLQQAFTEIQNNSIILIEDIDTNTVTNARNKKFKEKIDIKKKNNETDENSEEDDEDDENKTEINLDKRITLSGLLNVIDGVCSTEGRILFLTSNNPNALDSALLRPGRVDFKQYVGYPGEEERAELFARFFPEYKDQAIKFAQNCKKDLTGAELQQIFIEHADDPSVLISENYYKDL